MKVGLRSSKNRSRPVIVVALLAVGSVAWACGPNFYAWLITRGKSAMLYAPYANFGREITPLVKSRKTAHRHVESAAIVGEPAVENELRELDDALKAEGVTEANRRRLFAEYGDARSEMLRQVADRARWAHRWNKQDGQPEPEFRPPALSPMVPREFRLYYEGAIAYEKPDRNGARNAWTELLALPAEQRQWRSIWAAYMLARLHHPEDSGSARKYYRMSRELARGGFKDSQGLAAASLGWEAQLALNDKDFASAIHLYLDHYATGETNTSVQSLRITAAIACKTGIGALRPLVHDAQARQIITAYLLSRVPHMNWYDPEEPDRRVLNWLEAVEKENGADVEMAERLALIAYQSGELMVAGRWLRRAKDDTLLTLWLRAKLLLWEGDLDGAAKIYDRIIARHANALEDPIHYQSGEWFDALRTRFDYDETNPASRALAAEAGLVRLHRHEFTGALDVLARAGFWMDAAYLGERILTLEELKTYVDENWTAPDPARSDQRAIRRNTAWGPNANLTGIGLHFRHLLARRLARAQRYDEAKNYFPSEYTGDFDLFTGALKIGSRPSTPLIERKAALVGSARLLRHKGMEFIGTELAPDGAWAGGNFGEGITFTNRSHLKPDEFIAPSDAEGERYARHGPRLDRQFHYRYLAADLAWEASLLMENNSLELARWYCEVGDWLKNRDPKEADRFYKALVQRCRKTDIGAAADKKRWFPKLDEDGNLAVPPKPKS